MAIQIANDKACLRITNNGSVTMVQKSQVRTVDTIGNTSVRIDIGAGSLKNIYIKLSEIDSSLGLTNVNQLRDYIAGLLEQTSSTSSGSQAPKYAVRHVQGSFVNISGETNEVWFTVPDVFVPVAVVNIDEYDGNIENFRFSNNGISFNHISEALYGFSSLANLNNYDLSRYELPAGNYSRPGEAWNVYLIYLAKL